MMAWRSHRPLQWISSLLPQHEDEILVRLSSAIALPLVLMLLALSCSQPLVLMLLVLLLLLPKAAWGAGCGWLSTKACRGRLNVQLPSWLVPDTLMTQGQQQECAVLQSHSQLGGVVAQHERCRSCHCTVEACCA